MGFGRPPLGLATRGLAVVVTSAVMLGVCGVSLPILAPVHSMGSNGPPKESPFGPGSENQLPYVANRESQSLTVLGTPLYGVTFTETGLPAGWNWSVVLNNGSMAKSSTTSSIDFLLGPGSYSYTVQGFAEIPIEPLYMAYFSTGQLRVIASNLTLPFQFAPTAWLKVVVAGIPSNVSWQVTATNFQLGVWRNMTGVGPTAPGTFGFFVFANETYSYSVGFSGNYSQWDVSGSITVGSQGATISVLAGSQPIGVPSSTIVPLAITILGVGVGSVATVLLRLRRHTPPSGHL